MWGRSSTPGHAPDCEVACRLYPRQKEQCKASHYLTIYCECVQVGFIANLRNKRSHVIVEQVSTSCLQSDGTPANPLCGPDIICRCAVPIRASLLTPTHETALQALTSLRRMHVGSSSAHTNTFFRVPPRNTGCRP